MEKANRRLLQVVVIVCVIIVFTASALVFYNPPKNFTDQDFPLEVDLARTVFSVGENITFTASIINRSGREVNVTSNGFQPAAWFYNINDNPVFAETSMLAFQYLKPNEKISHTYEFQATSPGTYTLYVRHQIGIDNFWSSNQHLNITIEVG
jgi:hypothetical protein